MVGEFGQPGVENAKVVDLIKAEAGGDLLTLTMIERRPWGADPRQFQQIEEKINRYLGYVLDGFLVEHYPQFEGKRVQLRLQCAEAPHGEAVRFVAAATDAIEAQGIGFIVDVVPPA